MLHEIAISSFQLVEFGRGCSVMFLATIAATASFRGAAGAAALLQAMPRGGATNARAQLHGIDWERERQFPVTDVRARHGITPFAGTFPGALFEQARAAA